MNNAFDAFTQLLSIYVIKFTYFSCVKMWYFLALLEKFKDLVWLLGGLDINIKPDDCADLAWGCNKTRNLEFWAVNTIAKGADTWNN